LTGPRKSRFSRGSAACTTCTPMRAPRPRSRRVAPIPSPLQEFAVAQQGNPYQSTRLLLDGQQRLTSLSAVIRGGPVNVRGRKRPIELLFNLEHPEKPTVVTEVNEEGEDDDDDEGDDELIDDEADSTEDELQKRFDRITFVVATRKLEQLSHWVTVTEVFASAHARFPCASSHIN
jgi:hypothetical protein